MHSVSTNQIADSLHFNDKVHYLLYFSDRLMFCFIHLCIKFDLLRSHLELNYYLEFVQIGSRQY